MTYIAAFECVGGIVMVSDTQETHGITGRMNDEKEYIEKLYVPENLSYPIAVGGAGLGEPIEAFALELFERIEKAPPSDSRELRTTIKDAIEEVHNSDKRVSAWPTAYRTTCCIVAAKPPNDGFALFMTTGKRVLPQKREPVLIGYDTPSNRALLNRLYRPTMTIAQGIIVGAYLVAQSKNLNPGVGFDTRVATVASHGAFMEDQEYIGLLETRARDLLRAFDDLFLVTADVAINDWEFSKALDEFQKSVKEKRFAYRKETSLSLMEKLHDPKWHGDAYAKLPDGTATSGRTLRCVLYRDKKQWLLLHDGYTDDGREKMKLVHMNSPEAEGKESFHKITGLIGVPIEELLTHEGQKRYQKTLSDNADKLQSTVRVGKSAPESWTLLPVRTHGSTPSADSEQQDKRS